MYWTCAVGSTVSTATARTGQKACSLKRRRVRPQVNTGLQVCVCLPIVCPVHVYPRFLPVCSPLFPTF